MSNCHSYEHNESVAKHNKLVAKHNDLITKYDDVNTKLGGVIQQNATLKGIISYMSEKMDMACPISWDKL